MQTTRLSFISYIPDLHHVISDHQEPPLPCHEETHHRQVQEEQEGHLGHPHFQVESQRVLAHLFGVCRESFDFVLAELEKMEATRGKGKILIDGHFMPYSRLPKMVGDEDYGHTEDDNDDYD